MSADCIEKNIVLRAPLSRVWKAVADSAEFGKWFGVKFAGPFVAGESLKGAMAPTLMDPKVAEMQQDFEGMPFEIWVEQVEPEQVFSFRWHPYAIEEGKDFSQEPTTLVTFHLWEVDGGTSLTITECGFDQIPVDRRAKAFASNSEGWAIQTTLIEKYLASHAS
ncbi:MAG: SRPBCC family protein [Armatimonas sp.]